MSENIKVAIRLRPLISREIKSGLSTEWKVKDSTCIQQKTMASTAYCFDRVFDCEEDNDIVYQDLCTSIVDSIMKGFNGTIFAYGQTSSGKTYTMAGEFGIIAKAIGNIFDAIDEMPDREFLLRVSYMEIYNEVVYDLLNPESKNLKIYEDTNGVVSVTGLTEVEIRNAEDVFSIMSSGEKGKRIASTVMNERSSRSHTIFRMIVESRVYNNDEDVTVAQLNLVDLAGSERASSNHSNEQFKEGCHINKSLLALTHVIRQLSDGDKQYISYRDSKLTRILQNSLGGNANTVIICTVTPTSVEQTLSTLKFASFAKRITNKPIANVISNDQALLKCYSKQIKQLNNQLVELQKATENNSSKLLKEENETLKNQIQSLKEKFIVSQIRSHSPLITKKLSRRETWCYSKSLKVMTPAKDQDFSPHLHMGKHPRPLNPLTKPLQQFQLPVLQEESPTPRDSTDSVEASGIGTSPNVFVLDNYQTVSIQTEDVEIFDEDKKRELETYKNEIAQLKLREGKTMADLEELREFTTWEKQILSCERNDTIMTMQTEKEALEERVNNLTDFERLSHEQEKTIQDLEHRVETSCTLMEDKQCIQEKTLEIERLKAENRCLLIKIEELETPSETFNISCKCHLQQITQNSNRSSESVDIANGNEKQASKDASQLTPQFQSPQLSIDKIIEDVLVMNKISKENYLKYDNKIKFLQSEIEAYREKDAVKCLENERIRNLLRKAVSIGKDLQLEKKELVCCVNKLNECVVKLTDANEHLLKKYVNEKASTKQQRENLENLELENRQLEAMQLALQEKIHTLLQRIVVGQRENVSISVVEKTLLEKLTKLEDGMKAAKLQEIKELEIRLKESYRVNLETQISAGRSRHQAELLERERKSLQLRDDFEEMLWGRVSQLEELVNAGQRRSNVTENTAVSERKYQVKIEDLEKENFKLSSDAIELGEKMAQLREVCLLKDRAALNDKKKFVEQRTQTEIMHERCEKSTLTDLVDDKHLQRSKVNFCQDDTLLLRDKWNAMAQAADSSWLKVEEKNESDEADLEIQQFKKMLSEQTEEIHGLKEKNSTLRNEIRRLQNAHSETIRMRKEDQPASPLKRAKGGVVEQVTCQYLQSVIHQKERHIKSLESKLKDCHHHLTEPESSEIGSKTSDNKENEDFSFEVEVPDVKRAESVQANTKPIVNQALKEDWDQEQCRQQ